MPRTVIIDGDILVYKTAEAITEHIEVESEETEDFLYQTISWGSKSKAKECIEKKVDNIKKKTKATSAVICLSDAKANFRKQLLPTYKGKRKAVKPVFYNWLRQYFHDNYTTFERPTLEADDLMGIIVTYKGKLKGIPEGEKVLWSMDKDFKTIPCIYYREDPNGELTENIITEQQADWFFMLQTLTGDSVDNYKGCPGYGEIRAREVLTPLTGDFNLATAWKTVVKCFESQNLTEEDALVQARCARILRAEDYDFKTKEVKLWKL